MIDYSLLNALLTELKRTNTSVDYKLFFERILGKSADTFKQTRLLIEKITDPEDGYAKKTPHGTYVILTPKGAEFEGYKDKKMNNEKKIFISHSSKDAKIVEQVIRDSYSTVVLSSRLCESSSPTGTDRVFESA